MGVDANESPADDDAAGRKMSYEQIFWLTGWILSQVMACCLSTVRRALAVNLQSLQMRIIFISASVWPNYVQFSVARNIATRTKESMK